MLYYTSHTIAFHDGEYLNAKDAQVGLYAHTLHYGSGVFDGLRSYATPNGTKIFRAKAHFVRLLNACKKLNIHLEYSVDELKKIAYSLLEKNRLSNAYIRILVYLNPDMAFGGNPQSKLFIATWQWGKFFGDDLLNVKISSFRRPSQKAFFTDTKIVGHYVNSNLATKEAKINGFDEALLLDQMGNVAQGSAGNFFYEKDNVLFTPPLDNIFPGITRNTILQLAKEEGIEVRVQNINQSELKYADAAFFTGTAAEVAGINSIDGHKMQLDWEETLSYVLACKYNQLVRQQEYHFSTVI